MRPPQNAGEDVGILADLERVVLGFNEAPAERGGRHNTYRASRNLRNRFNEAPAERGGRLLRLRDGHPVQVEASMRPPQNAGEDAALAASATQSVAVAWRE